MRTNERLVLAALAMLAAACLPAFAQETVPAETEPAAVAAADARSLQTLWEDFLHYSRIARADLAASFGQAILDSGSPPRELYLLAVETGETQAVLARAAQLEGLAGIVSQLQQMIEAGFQAERESPQQIAAAIEMLGGTIRGYEIAARRLETSGEYALPQLVQKLTDPATTGTLRERIIRVLPRLGKDAVRPLSVALQADNQQLLQILADALGEIRYPHAAGRLKELTQRDDILPETRTKAQRALVACVGQEALTQPLSALYYDQALAYYYQRESVAPDNGSDQANVWYWQDGLLTYVPVPRAIFCDIYTMRMSRLALGHDADYYPAVSLWLAANLKRAADLPDAAADSTYGEGTPNVEYFALASSAKYLQDVLARALQDHNSAVATGAITALAETAGAENLVEPVAGGAQPLVQALTFPDRNVRFLAAVSLANALPKERFNGDELVMSQLIEALRQTGRKTALLIVADQDKRNALKDALRAAGYDVIDEPGLQAAMAAASSSAGVDVAVLADAPDAGEAVGEFRRNPAFATLPVMVAGQTERLRSLAEQDQRTVLVAADADAEAIAAGLGAAAELAAGEPMDEQLAREWTIRAADAIAYLGETGNTVFDILRAEGALDANLDDPREDVRLAASKALSVTRSPLAQRDVAGLALDPQTPENIRIAAFGDLSASLRRYGNLLTEELSEQTVDVVTREGSPELLNAAAQALGAMNLPSEKIKVLILTTDN